MEEGFMFATPDDAMKFFEACIEAKAVTREEKLAVMRQMVKEKKAKYLRDPKELLKGKNIIGFKPQNNKGDSK
jgi:hypothetical protein